MYVCLNGDGDELWGTRFSCRNTKVEDFRIYYREQLYSSDVYYIRVSKSMTADGLHPDDVGTL